MLFFSVPKSSSYTDYGPDKLIDGITNNDYKKFAAVLGSNANGNGIITFDMGAENSINITKFNHYAYYSFKLEDSGGGTSYYRTRMPSSWEIYGSNDGTNWTLLDSRSNITPPSTSYTKTQNFEFSYLN